MVVTISLVLYINIDKLHSSIIMLKDVQLEIEQENIFVETERFFLREILHTDVEGMFELDSDTDVHTYIGNQLVRTKEQSIEVIDFIRKQYVDNGIGRWAIIDKRTKEFVGWSGFRFETILTHNHINYYDLGYRLIKKYWGQGIATETALGSLAFAFNKLETKEVFAMADILNVASNRVLQKVGLQLIESFPLEGVEHNWYRITRSAFKEQEAHIQCKIILY